MKIDQKLISRLEKLARIQLSPESVGRMADQLGSIIAYFDQLQEIDTTHIPPTDFLFSTKTAHLRKDRVVEGLPRDAALEAAPDAVKGFFRVPKVIDRGEG